MRTKSYKIGPKRAARSKAAKKRSAKRFLRPVQRKAVRQIVKEAVSRRLENKHSILSGYDDHNSAIQLTADFHPILNTIPQGTGEGYRVGDSIKTKYLRVMGTVSLNRDPNPSPSAPTYPQDNPITCRLMCVSQNDVKRQSMSSALDYGNLLRNASSSGSGGFNGAIWDLTLPINSDKFKVHFDRVFTLVPVPGHPPDGASRTMYMFKFYIKVPATLKFDASSDYPNNFASWLTLGYAYTNGTPADTVQTPVHLVWNSELVYEDA